MKEEIVRDGREIFLLFCSYFLFIFLPCSKYLCSGFNMGNCVFLKHVENRGKTIKTLVIPLALIQRTYISNSVPIKDNIARVFLWWSCHYHLLLRKWRLSHQGSGVLTYLDDDDEIAWSTYYGDKQTQIVFPTCLFSHNYTMIVICHGKKGALWYIDMDHSNCLTCDYICGLLFPLSFLLSYSTLMHSLRNGTQSLSFDDDYYYEWGW